jgi:diguanylate cyclase (GGDEF)-like protein/PAS domain S-box-containing protein
MADIFSMGLRRANGNLLGDTGEHDQLWDPPDKERSTPSHVRIPIFRGEKRWGSLEIRFAELDSGGFFGLLGNPLYKLLAVMATIGFAAYLLYLSRTLRYLDPSSVVPDRVRAALDQLVEGALILDSDQRIVLVNLAFANKVDRTPDALLGVDPSSLAWVKDSDKGEITELPWAAVMRDGERRTDVRLELDSPSQGIRVLTSNVSPIVDGSGNRRGVLATFDDISDTERINEGLREALEKLELAHAEVRDKNAELFRLATIDPLTGSLNRRAFFEKLELEFNLAGREKLELSVVMADIDFFKRINDDLGHGVGDIVIKDMANVLSESSRVNDCVGRYGGEEFCMVLVATNVDEAKIVSERARLAFESLSQASDSATSGRKVTASFGVSSIKFGAADIAELLNQADMALYESKHNGRNQVTDWTSIETAKREAT